MAVYKSKTATKDGRQYFFRCRFKDVYGVIHDYTSQKYANPKIAKMEEAKYLLQEKNPQTDEMNILNLFNEFIIHKSKKIKEQSIVKLKDRFKHLKPLYKKQIKDITIPVIQSIQKDLDKKCLSPKHKNNILLLLKDLIKYSNKYHNTSDAMLKYIELYSLKGTKKEMDFFTLEEYLKFESVIDTPEELLFFQMLYYLGLRESEARALTYKDVLEDKVFISKTITSRLSTQNWAISSPKTKGSIRTLPLPKKVLNSLKIVKEYNEQFEGFNTSWYIFGGITPWSESYIYKKKNEYCKLAKVKQIRIHDFRHSCASLLINQGASINLVSKYLGHSNITTTLNTYTHLYKSELYQMTTIIDDLNG